MSVHRGLFAKRRNLKVWCDFDVTTISISWNNRLWWLGSLCQLPQLYNKKVKNIFMFMRYIYTTAQDLESRSVAVVVEFHQRSKCFKLLVTDSILIQKSSQHGHCWHYLIVIAQQGLLLSMLPLFYQQQIKLTFESMAWRTWEIHVRCLIPKSQNLGIFVCMDSPKFCPHHGSDLAFAQNLSAHWIRH